MFRMTKIVQKAVTQGKKLAVDGICITHFWAFAESSGSPCSGRTVVCTLVLIPHDLYLHRSFVRFDIFTGRSICCMEGSRSARCQTVTSLHLPLQRPRNSRHSQNEVIIAKQKNTLAVLLVATNGNVLALSVWDVLQGLNKEEPS
jgi:hypothetical protein